MDLFDVARSCFRRWYVLLPLLAITAWYSYSTYSSVQPVYYANTIIGLAPPRVSGRTHPRPAVRSGETACSMSAAPRWWRI